MQHYEVLIFIQFFKSESLDLQDSWTTVDTGALGAVMMWPDTGDPDITVAINNIRQVDVSQRRHALVPLPCLLLYTAEGINITVSFAHTHAIIQCTPK